MSFTQGEKTADPSVQQNDSFTHYSFRPATAGAIGITILVWASAFVGIRAGLHGYSPTSLALLRYVIASLMLAVYAKITRMPLPRWRDIAGLLLTGIIGIALYTVALNSGEVSVSAGIANFLVNTSPVITALLAVILLKERLRLWGWIGILICISGVAIIAWSGGEGTHISVGALWVLGASLADGLYFVLQKPSLARYSALQCTTYAIWGGTLALLIFTPGLLTDLRHASWPATMAVGYLGIFPGAIGYLSWAYALARLPAARAASFLYLTPAVTLVIGWIWLGEWLPWLALLGGGLTLIGVICVNILGVPTFFPHRH